MNVGPRIRRNSPRVRAGCAAGAREADVGVSEGAVHGGSCRFLLADIACRVRVVLLDGTEKLNLALRAASIDGR